jgi:glycosyltransferase involved in cell wall biosynthesis
MKNREQKLNLAYITSMKHGLSAFNYREIEELTKRGVNVFLFPTKYGTGPYMPTKDQECYVYKPYKVLLKQSFFFMRNPIKYSKIVAEAIKSKSLMDMVIAFDFASQMKKKNIDRIHCHHGDHKLFIGYYCKKILNIPLSVTIHSHSLYVNPNWELFKKSLNACDTIISISDYNKKMLTEKFGVDSKKVQVIRLFVDTEEFKPNETKRILIVGQFAERKGHEILFNAVKKLNRNDIKIWVVGGGTWDQVGFVDVRQLAKDMNLEDKIIFFGMVSDEALSELYELCDIFCLPSRTSSDGNKEGIPVTLMEAMSYGKPVISTRHAGIPELVEEILVEENDVNELANAIELLADNPDLRKKLGDRNREIIEKKYSKKNLVKLQNCFTSLLSVYLISNRRILK